MEWPPVNSVSLDSRPAADLTRPALTPSYPVAKRSGTERLFLLEFNELCPQLLEQFMAEGRLPNFWRFYASSEIYTTDAGEPADNLEPWIQWPTVHSGLPYAEHGVYRLGDGRKLASKCLAEALSDAGVRVGVCGSMNTNYRAVNGYVLPDAWDKGAEAHPAELSAYSATLARLVQESSRDKASKKDLLKFGWFLAKHGLTTGAVWQAVRQLAAERLTKGLSWRRACVLDRFQYDLFRTLNRRHRVRFGTFFCNSTAHFQHYYWRNMEPAAFDVPPPETDSPSLKDAIRTGYERMDKLVGRFLKHYGKDRLILCTALSQQPWADTTKCTYRPVDFDRLFAFAGVSLTKAAAKPVMAEQFHLDCGTPGAAEVAAAALKDLSFGNEPVMAVRRDGANLFAGCRIVTPGVMDTPVVRQSTGEAKTFRDLFYPIHTMRSGRHHPDGVLWVRTGLHRIIRDRVPLTAVAPTILAHFGVEAPATMRTPPLTMPR